ncbi:hypothetical protein PF010_g31543 [Phytophthora fragariae]|uniref:RxLR effector protein n=1 Tax=Phytophthora fragariae TaxID=53985 RepID=A0A6G0MBG2_9STRA|nr:hypothetical protein PF010_g31543 [Phytophthora fragariae]KAE9160387.1 hypothetical protein PF004_g31200 [Phytophthora fragariae]
MPRFTRWFVFATVAAATSTNLAISHPDTTTPSADFSADQHVSRKLFVENGRRLLKNCIHSDIGRDYRVQVRTGLFPSPPSSQGYTWDALHTFTS